MSERLILILLGMGAAMAQTQVDLRTQVKRVDFSSASYTKPVRVGAALPVSCTEGELFFLTGAPVGTSMYACQTADKWSVTGAQSCRYDAATATLQCKDDSGITQQITAVSVGALGDPETNGVVYRSAKGTTAAANVTQLSIPFGCQDAGSINAYACNLTPPIAIYSSGTSYWFQANSTNSGAATVNFNGLGARSILKTYNQPLTAGDIRAGQWVVVIYDGTAMQMQSQAGNSLFSFAGRTGTVTPATGDYSTAQVTENENLYFTKARAQGAFSFPGVVRFTSGAIDCPNCITTATNADTDLSGSFPHLSVTKLQGLKLSPANPADQQFLGWSSTWAQWQPMSSPVPSVFGRSGAVTAQTGDYSFSQISGSLGAGQLPAGTMLSNQSNTITAGSQDFSGAAHTLPMKSGELAARPSSCKAGEAYFATDAPAGGNVYGCTAANTWSQQGAPLTVESNGTVVGARSTTNFQTGPGLISVISDDGTAVNVLSALDTAMIQTQPGEQSGVALLCASSGGSTTRYQCALSPTATAYATGMVLHWIPDVSSGGVATTLNVDSLGAVPIKAADGIANPGLTDIISGRMNTIWYDGTCFRLPAVSGVAGGVSDPGANGIMYRSSANTTVPATADNLSSASVCQDTGSTNSYACNMTPAINAYGAGTTYWFRAANANTGASTISFNSLPAKAVKKHGALALAAGDIQSGQWVGVTYDGTNMQMQSQLANPPAGGVSTVFGRTGAVTAQAGDYTAAQVTNAVDQTGAYTNPSWIPSYSWLKLTDVPSSFNAGQFLGRGLAATAPSNGQVYQWNSSASQWQPATVSSAAAAPGGSNGQLQYNNNGALAGLTASGDAAISTSTGVVTVQGIQGRTVSSTAPANGQVLQWSSSTSQYQPATIASGSGCTITGPQGFYMPFPFEGLASYIMTATHPNFFTLVPLCNVTFSNVTYNVGVTSGTTCPGGTCGLQFGIYDVSGNLLYSSAVATSGGTPNINATGWQTLAWGSSVTLTAGTPYRFGWVTDSTALGLLRIGQTTGGHEAIALGNYSGAVFGGYGSTSTSGNGGSLTLPSTMGAVVGRADQYGAPIAIILR